MSPSRSATPGATASTHAVLGLLALRPWTAYELVGQTRRSMRWFWPRSEAHGYAELKRLVRLGWAEVEVEKVGRRRRSAYTITAAGREALTAWLATEPAPPVLEVEGALRLLLGDQAPPAVTARALQATARHARELDAAGLEVVADLLATGGPFPDRLHLVVPLAELYHRFLVDLAAWCDATGEEVASWGARPPRGLDDGGRARLARLLAADDR